MAEVLQLNVGGCLYATTNWTLNREPTSWLAKMFNVRDNTPVTVNGAYFINGDGPIFRHVLNFLRRGKLTLPDDFNEWELLASEADFYQLGALVEAVKAEKRQRVVISAVPNVSYSYIGSSSIFQKPPSLVDFFKPYIDPAPSIFLSDVQVTLTVKVTRRDSGSTPHRRFEKNLAAILKEIEGLGFRAEKQSCTTDEIGTREELGWTFARRTGG